jgi:hypothetical protein
MRTSPKNILLGFLLISLTGCFSNNSNQPATFDGASVVPVADEILLSEAIARQLETENQDHADYWRLYWSEEMGGKSWGEDNLENAARLACNEPGPTIEFLPKLHTIFIPLYFGMANFNIENSMRTAKTGVVNISKLVNDEEIYRTAIETSLKVRCPDKTMVNWRRMDNY